MTSAVHPLIHSIKTLAAEKNSKLCISLDVTSAAELLRLVELLAPYVLMFKTHIDILEDFSYAVIEKLLRLSEQYHFFIFEDRKFADIGNTVSMQYAKGIYHIADWAHITNAHILPGPGIIESLREVGLPKNRGLLLLAEMSSAGHLMNEAYQEKALHWANQYQDFVIGFVAQRCLDRSAPFLTFTPGVHKAASGDHLGQQYTTPEQAFARGADVIIVGRGIYAAENPVATIQDYLI
jgi:orotidine 5'-phosphate decarboxylase subfamily 1